MARDSALKEADVKTNGLKPQKKGKKKGKRGKGAMKQLLDGTIPINEKHSKEFELQSPRNRKMTT